MSIPRRSLALHLAMALVSLPTAELANHDVLISEYEEGSSNNNALALYNATHDPIDLAAGNYQVWIYANGSSSPTIQIPLSGTIAGGGVHVLAHALSSPALLALADETS